MKFVSENVQYLFPLVLMTTMSLLIRNLLMNAPSGIILHTVSIYKIVILCLWRNISSFRHKTVALYPYKHVVKWTETD